MKLTSPDYADCDKEEAVADFLKRIDCYKLTYVPLDDDKDRSGIPPYFPAQIKSGATTRCEAVILSSDNNVEVRVVD